MKKVSTLALVGCLLVGTLCSHSASAQSPVFGPNNILGNQTNNPFYIQAAPTNVDGPYLEFVNNNFTSPTNRAGSIGYIAGYNSAVLAGISHTFYSRTSTGGYVSNMRILQNGQVQIGQQAPTSSQTDYGLSVDGKIVAKSVYVTPPATWADFVFEPTYKLLSLTTLAEYLQTNKHLPNIPSAKEVEANGYNLGNMDVKLLQSLEELTLHVIELGKQNEQLRSRVAELERTAAAKN